MPKKVTIDSNGRKTIIKYPKRKSVEERIKQITEKLGHKQPYHKLPKEEGDDLLPNVVLPSVDHAKDVAGNLLTANDDGVNLG